MPADTHRQTTGLTMCTQQLPQPAQSGCCANSSAHSSRARLAAPSFTAQCLRVPVPVTPPRLFSQPAANLEGNPSLSLVYLCFSPTTATVEKSFPFSCEHLPLQTLFVTTSTGQGRGNSALCTEPAALVQSRRAGCDVLLGAASRLSLLTLPQHNCYQPREGPQLPLNYFSPAFSLTVFFC